MKYALAIGLALSASFNIEAAPIYGAFEVGDNRVYINQQGNRFELLSSGVEVDKDLARLQHGDYLAVDGYFNPKNKTIHVQSVDWVGLRRLLGKWKTKDNKIIEFNNFTSLMLHNYDNGGFPLVRPARAKASTVALNYRVAPGVGSSWSIFISDNKQLHLGRFTLHNNTLTINFFAVDTGHILKTLRLSRLAQWNEYP